MQSSTSHGRFINPSRSEITLQRVFWHPRKENRFPTDEAWFCGSKRMLKLADEDQLSSEVCVCLPRVENDFNHGFIFSHQTGDGDITGKFNVFISTSFACWQMSRDGQFVQSVPLPPPPLMWGAVSVWRCGNLWQRLMHAATDDDSFHFLFVFKIHFPVVLRKAARHGYGPIQLKVRGRGVIWLTAGLHHPGVTSTNLRKEVKMPAADSSLIIHRRQDKALMIT